MRFSSIFHMPRPQPLVARSPAPAQAQAAEEPAPQVTAPQAAPPASELPDDLDVRVRMLGEW